MKRWLGVAALAFAVLLSSCGPDSETPPERLAQSVTGGQIDNGHAAVGRLLGAAQTTCSATLIGPKTAVTAAHCIPDGGSMQVQFNGAQSVAVSQARVHPDYVDGFEKNFDIALLKLASAPAVDSAVVSEAAPRRGQPVTVVGYGATACKSADAGVDAGFSCTGAGTKRSATNSVEQVYQSFISIAGDGGPCMGDSGGAVFAMLDGQELLVAMPVHGALPCGTRAYAHRLDAVLGWLQTQTDGGIRSVIPPDSGSEPDPDPGSKHDAGTQGTDDGGTVPVPPGPRNRPLGPVYGGCSQLPQTLVPWGLLLVTLVFGARRSRKNSVPR